MTHLPQHQPAGALRAILAPELGRPEREALAFHWFELVALYQASHPGMGVGEAALIMLAADMLPCSFATH